MRGDRRTMGRKGARADWVEQRRERREETGKKKERR